MLLKERDHVAQSRWVVRKNTLVTVYEWNFLLSDLMALKKTKKQENFLLFLYTKTLQFFEVLN